MEFHRKNHFIPQFYLKYWAKNNLVLIHRNIVSNKNIPIWEKKTVKSIGFYSDLYTDIIEGTETDEVERWLDGEFENPAKSILDKISRGTLLNNEEYKLLTKYVFSQIVRTPKFIKNNQKNWYEVAQKSIENATSKLSKTKVDITERSNVFEGDVHLPIKVEVIKDIDEKTSLLKVETHVGRGFWLYNIKHLLINTIQQLPEYKWSIYQAPANLFWPTSDNPVLLLNYYSNLEYDFKGGLGKEGTEIIFPITPHHLLYTQVGKKNPRYVNPSIELYEKLTKLICENSDELIISLKEIPEIELIIERCIDGSMKNNGTEAWIKEQTELDSQFYKSDDDIQHIKKC